MRSFKELTTDLIKKPPMLFPLVGLFHVLWLLLFIVLDYKEPFPNIVWLGVVWTLGYTVFWLAACDLRKWGALGYIALTLINTVLYYIPFKGGVHTEYGSNMPLIDGLFSFFLVFYYRRFK